MGISVLIICKFSNERMCTRKKDVEKLSCGFEEYLYLPTKVHNFTEKYVSKIYKSGQPHQNVNNLIINTCRFCINRDKWGGYKDEKFQQFTISPP